MSYRAIERERAKNVKSAKVYDSKAKMAKLRKNRYGTGTTGPNLDQYRYSIQPVTDGRVHIRTRTGNERIDRYIVRSSAYLSSILSSSYVLCL